MATNLAVGVELAFGRDGDSDLLDLLANFAIERPLHS
jgi:hypothetical protein